MSESIRKFLTSDSERRGLVATGVYVTHSRVENDFEMHTHDFSETFIIVSGSAAHVQGGQKYPLCPGDVFTIMGDTAHGFADVRDMDIINLQYNPGFFEQTYSEIRSIPGFDPLFLVEPAIRLHRACAPALRLNEAALSHVVMMADFIIEQQKGGSAGLYPVIRMNAMALASYLAAQYDVQRDSLSQIAALSRALAYMEQHLAEPVRIADIAQSAFMSVRQLERLFIRFYAESPMKHLQQMRMKNALTLLVRRNESVASAAVRSGFEDPSYFARMFRKVYGISPSAARNHIKEV